MRRQGNPPSSTAVQSFFIQAQNVGRGDNMVEVQQTNVHGLGGTIRYMHV